MSTTELAVKVSSIESINKLLMLDHLYGTEDLVLKNYITAISNAIEIGRSRGYKSAVKSLLGKNYKIQSKNLFKSGGYCEALHLEDSVVDKIYSSRFRTQDVEDCIDRFKRNNNVGHVYIIAGTHNGKTRFKIGKAVDIKQRLKTFEVRIPFDIDLVFAIEVKNPSQVESQIHKIFSENRKAGEWFDFNSDTLVACILTMYSIQSANGGFAKEWLRFKDNESKLEDDGYIEYLESLLVMNDVKFDQSKRKEQNNG